MSARQTTIFQVFLEAFKINRKIIKIALNNYGITLSFNCSFNRLIFKILL